LFSGSLKRLSLSLSSGGLNLFSLSLLFFDGFLLFSLDSLLLELLNFLAFFYLGLFDLAGGTGVLILSLFLFDLHGFLRSSGGLHDRDLGFSLGLDGSGSFKDNRHGGLDHCGSPVIFDPCDIIGHHVLLFLVAVALFVAIGEWVSHFKVG